VLVVDEHPLLPTSLAVRSALDRVAGQIEEAGARVMRSSPLLPDLALQGRTYSRLLQSVFGADFAEDVYARVQELARGLSAGDVTLRAERVRGTVLSHRDWIKADRVRLRLADDWRAVFRAFDVVLCPVMPTVAFPHDHGDMVARRLTIDDTSVAYIDQVMWAGVATLPGLPATAMPIGLSDAGLPIGMQVVGPYLEDRTPLAFAALAERELGGFAAPPGSGR
jgi:amidase